MTNKCDTASAALCLRSGPNISRFFIFAGVSELWYSHCEIRLIEVSLCDADAKQLSMESSELFRHKLPGEPAKRPTRDPKGFASKAAFGLCLGFVTASCVHWKGRCWGKGDDSRDAFANGYVAALPRL